MKWCALMLLVAGCGSGSVTEIFACYSIDPALVSETTVVRICVRDEEGEVVHGCGDARLSLANTGVTASQGFVQSNAQSLIFEIEAEAPVAGRTATISQSLRVPFVDGEIIDVTLHLDASCADRVCDPGETCVSGECQASEVGTRCLTPHGLEPLAECTDPRLISICNAP